MTEPHNSLIICIDANVLLRRLLGGPMYEKTRIHWLNWNKDQTTLIAPPLFYFEITAVIWRYVYLKQITRSESQDILQTAFAQDIQMRYPSQLHTEALAIANEINLAQAYDAHYIALARIYQCQFWTLDKKLYQTAGNKFPFIQLIS